MEIENKKAINIIGALSAFFVFFYMAYIFILGTKREWIPEMMQSGAIRLYIIYGLHAISGIFAIIYYASFCNIRRYKGKIVLFPVINIVVLVMGAFYIYKIGLEALILSMTLNGALLGVFLWIREEMLAGISNSDGAQMPIFLKMVKVLAIVSIVGFVFSALVYHRYITWFLVGYISSYQIDALSIFSYMVSALAQVVALILPCFIDITKLDF